MRAVKVRDLQERVPQDSISLLLSKKEDPKKLETKLSNLGFP